MKRTLGLVVALVTAAALAGACGSTPPPETPPAATAEPAPSPPDGAPAPSGEPSAAPVPSGAPKAGPSGAPSQPFGASKLIEDVKKLGIDLSKGADLSTLPMDKKKKIMPIMQKALGFESCAGCHAEGDTKADTRNKKIAAGCWKTFVKPLRDEKGGPIFCDSCHGGKAKILNRSDVDALKKFMEDQYEHKLTRADKKETECSTCHGEAVELKIFDKIWKVPAK